MAVINTILQTCIRILEGRVECVTSCSFSHDSSPIVSSSADDSVRVRDLLV